MIEDSYFRVCVRNLLVSKLLEASIYLRHQTKSITMTCRMTNDQEFVAIVTWSSLRRSRSLLQIGVAMVVYYPIGMFTSKLRLLANHATDVFKGDVCCHVCDGEYLSGIRLRPPQDDFREMRRT